jgi:hypothetical protein
VLGGLRIVIRIICVVCSGTRKLGVVVIRVGERSLGTSNDLFESQFHNLYDDRLPGLAGHRSCYFLVVPKFTVNFFSFISPKRKIDERT